MTQITCFLITLDELTYSAILNRNEQVEQRHASEVEAWVVFTHCSCGVSKRAGLERFEAGSRLIRHQLRLERTNSKCRNFVSGILLNSIRV